MTDNQERLDQEKFTQERANPLDSNQKNPFEISGNMRKFLTLWLSNSDNDMTTEMQCINCLGLCDCLWHWSLAHFGIKAQDALQQELKDLFYSCDLCTIFPFGEYEFSGNNLQKDVNRVSWVRAALNGTLVHWELVVPLRQEDDDE